MKVESAGINSAKTIDFSTQAPKSAKNALNLRDEIESSSPLALETKELNRKIGILQIADRTITAMLGDNNLNLDSINDYLKRAKLLGKEVFSSEQMLMDKNGNILFNANEILDLIPHDERDIYAFRKVLRAEQNRIQDSLTLIKNELFESSGIIESSENSEIQSSESINKDFLVNNSAQFIRAHDAKKLASRVDLLLA